MNAIQSQISKLCFKDLFFRCVHGLDNRIPKHMVSLDEKYLRRCLEFMHNTALKAAQCNIPVTLRAAKMVTLSESLNTAAHSINLWTLSMHFKVEKHSSKNENWFVWILAINRTHIEYNHGDLMWSSLTLFGIFDADSMHYSFAYKGSRK